MKLLIAISSCQRDVLNGANQSLRDTWLSSLGFDYRFFVGQGDCLLQSDEVRLECGDSYIHLPAKTRESLRWALEHEYTHIFRVFTDTYVIGQNFRKKLREQWEGYDYIGVFPEPVRRGELNGWFYAYGGGGYWLSRRAANAVVDALLPAPEDGKWETFAEDVWVGTVLKPCLTWLQWKPVTGHFGVALPHLTANTVTLHLSVGESTFQNKTTYDIGWMYEAHHRVVG
jgi:hypothetical protein